MIGISNGNDSFHSFPLLLFLFNHLNAATSEECVRIGDTLFAFARCLSLARPDGAAWRRLSFSKLFTCSLQSLSTMDFHVCFFVCLSQFFTTQTKISLAKASHGCILNWLHVAMNAFSNKTREEIIERWWWLQGVQALFCTFFNRSFFLFLVLFARRDDCLVSWNRNRATTSIGR